MDELLDIVFGNADGAHRAHLYTRSFAQHEALGEFYAGARAAVDDLIEDAIGLEVEDPEPMNVNTMLGLLEEGLARVVGLRDKVCGASPALQAKHDDLVAVYAKALYKLRRFSRT